MTDDSAAYDFDEDDDELLIIPRDAIFSFIPEGPITGLPAISDAEFEAQLSEAIRQKALVRVDRLAENLHLRAIDPAANVRTLVDALDANYKLSGLAAKNQAKEQAAAAVSIVINMPSAVPGYKFSGLGDTIPGDAVVVETPTLPELTAVKVKEPEERPSNASLTSSFFAQPRVIPLPAV